MLSKSMYVALIKQPEESRTMYFYGTKPNVLNALYNRGLIYIPQKYRDGYKYILTTKGWRVRRGLLGLSRLLTETLIDD